MATRQQSTGFSGFRFPRLLPPAGKPFFDFPQLSATPATTPNTPARKHGAATRPPTGLPPLTPALKTYDRVLSTPYAAERLQKINGLLAAGDVRGAIPALQNLRRSGVEVFISSALSARLQKTPDGKNFLQAAITPLAPTSPLASLPKLVRETQTVQGPPARTVADTPIPRGETRAQRKVRLQTDHAKFMTALAQGKPLTRGDRERLAEITTALVNDYRLMEYAPKDTQNPFEKILNARNPPSESLVMDRLMHQRIRKAQGLLNVTSNADVLEFTQTVFDLFDKHGIALNIPESAPVRAALEKTPVGEAWLAWADANHSKRKQPDTSIKTPGVGSTMIREAYIDPVAERQTTVNNLAGKPLQSWTANQLQSAEGRTVLARNTGLYVPHDVIPTKADKQHARDADDRTQAVMDVISAMSDTDASIGKRAVRAVLLLPPHDNDTNKRVEIVSGKGGSPAYSAIGNSANDQDIDDSIKRGEFNLDPNNTGPAYFSDFIHGAKGLGEGAYSAVTFGFGDPADIGLHGGDPTMRGIGNLLGTVATGKGVGTATESFLAKAPYFNQLLQLERAGMLSPGQQMLLNTTRTTLPALTMNTATQVATAKQAATDESGNVDMGLFKEGVKQRLSDSTPLVTLTSLGLGTLTPGKTPGLPPTTAMLAQQRALGALEDIAGQAINTYTKGGSYEDFATALPGTLFTSTLSRSIDLSPAQPKFGDRATWINRQGERMTGVVEQVTGQNNRDIVVRTGDGPFDVEMVSEGTYLHQPGAYQASRSLDLAQSPKTSQGQAARTDTMPLPAYTPTTPAVGEWVTWQSNGMQHMGFVTNVTRSGIVRVRKPGTKNTIGLKPEALQRVPMLNRFFPVLPLLPVAPIPGLPWLSLPAGSIQQQTPANPAGK